MINLPYAVPPQPQQPHRRIGTPASGMLDVPILGGIAVKEAKTVEALLANQRSTFVVEASVAEEIATAENITILEAYSIVTEAARGRELTDPRAKEIALRYAEQINSITRAYSEIGGETMEAWAVAMIRHRLGQPDCTLADVRAMPRVLLQGLWGVVVDEQDAEKQPSEPVTEADLKKLPPADGDDPLPIGTQFSGDLPIDSLDSSPDAPSTTN